MRRFFFLKKLKKLPILTHIQFLRLWLLCSRPPLWIASSAPFPGSIPRQWTWKCYDSCFICIYTAVPVCERFATWDSLVSEGRFVRFTKDRSETESHLPGYEPITKIQNPRYEILLSIKLKSAKFNKKTYYHAFVRKILNYSIRNDEGP